MELLFPDHGRSKLSGTAAPILRMPVWLIEFIPKRMKKQHHRELGCRDLKRTEDQIAVSSILAALALAKGNLKLGAMLVQLDDSEIDRVCERTD